jgi:arylsulfatase
LQVPTEYLDKYAGQYDEGYDALRKQRFDSLMKAGVIPKDSTLPPRNDAIVAWGDLDQEQQREESRKMELYAAMVDNLDDHVGQLLDFLRDNGLYDNTVIVFMSDNGAAGEDFYNSGNYIDYLQKNFDNSYENMGRPDSFVSYGPQWAEAGSAPFRRYKGATLEGGIVAPLIVAGHGVASRDEVVSAYVSVMDIAPTILELAGTHYPARDGVEPMLGESAVELLSGDKDNVHDDQFVSALFHNGLAYIRQGNWKLVTVSTPFAESAFEMYDLATDPGETIDLAEQKPVKYDELIELWRTERKRLGIILPEDL